MPSRSHPLTNPILSPIDPVQSLSAAITSTRSTWSALNQDNGTRSPVIPFSRTHTSPSGPRSDPQRGNDMVAGREAGNGKSSALIRHLVAPGTHQLELDIFQRVKEAVQNGSADRGVPGDAIVRVAHDNRVE